MENFGESDILPFWPSNYSITFTWNYSQLDPSCVVYKLNLPSDPLLSPNHMLLPTATVDPSLHCIASEDLRSLLVVFHVTLSPPAQAWMWVVVEYLNISPTKRLSYIIFVIFSLLFISIWTTTLILVLWKLNVAPIQTAIVINPLPPKKS